jgi:hypothetical protein
VRITRLRPRLKARPRNHRQTSRHPIYAKI